MAPKPPLPLQTFSSSSEEEEENQMEQQKSPFPSQDSSQRSSSSSSEEEYEQVEQKLPLPAQDPPQTFSSSSSKEEYEQGEQKLPLPAQDPPQRSSSSSSSEEEEYEQGEQKLPLPAQDPPQTISSSSSEEEEEEEEEEEGKGNEAMDDEQKGGEQSADSKPSIGKPSTKPDSTPKSVSQKTQYSSDDEDSDSYLRPPTTGKQPFDIDEAATDSEQRSKRKQDIYQETFKKKSGDQRKLFQRVWDDSDEIVILRGIIDSMKKGLNPYADISGFLDFIKKFLHIDASRDQLRQKMRRLKEKYERNASRANDGNSHIFWKPHDVQCFELSKEIWGEKNNENKVFKRLKTSTDIPSSSRSKAGELLSSYQCPTKSLLPDLKENLLIGSSSEAKQKWRKLKISEIRVRLKWIDLEIKRAKLNLEALMALGSKSSN